MRNMQGGIGKVAYVPYRSRIVVIEVCLTFSFDVVFNFNVYPFPPSKSKLLGDVLMNRKNATGIWLFLCYNITCIAYVAWRAGTIAG